jgi:hypothetical protein
MRELPPPPLPLPPPPLIVWCCGAESPSACCYNFSPAIEFSDYFPSFLSLLTFFTTAAVPRCVLESSSKNKETRKVFYVTKYTI